MLFVVFFIFMIFFLQTSLAIGSQRCYFICLAQCVREGKKFDQCDPICETHHEDHCIKGSAGCLNGCNNLKNFSDVPATLIPPRWIHSNYAEKPKRNPYLVDLEWTSINGAKFYVVEFTENDDFPESEHEFEIFTSTKSQFNKTKLCSTYMFRIFAVNENAISEASLIANVSAPEMFVSNKNFTLNQVKFLTKPFIGSTGKIVDNKTIEIYVGYTPPEGWVSDYWPSFEAVPTCLRCFNSFEEFSSKPVVYNEPYIMLSVPFRAITCACVYSFFLNSIRNRCGSEIHSDTMLQVPLNCTTFPEANCTYKQRPTPTCRVLNFNSTYSLDDSTLSMHWDKPQTESSPISYEFTIYKTAKGQIGFLFENPKRQAIHHAKIEPTSNGSANVQVTLNLTSDATYYADICEKYFLNDTLSPGYHAPYPIDVPYQPAYPQTITVQSDLAPLVLTLVGLALLIIVAIMLIGWFKIRQKKFKAKRIDELGLDQRTGDEDSRYVMAPRRFDHWEISRKRLIVHEDQKLGSGAFGSVFKGQVSGKLLTHINSDSAFAQNWMKSENCEVAVKMLPEYADDGSKSEFLKEINLMKQIGFHDRIVNMLGCITADEPICLIVEYCSDGDLLHYLRERRNYMIKLEEMNININETSEDVDFSRILCLKDLISFAWQISIGMEYLSQKGYVHRDLAARNILVDKGKKAKIGDFGLCRYSCTDSIYVSKGGRLPFKWMALEAIKNYEFTPKSDVWSFGVLLFEIITLGGTPYPGTQPVDMETVLDSGKRMDRPENCPDQLYELMLNTWQSDPEKRYTFSQLAEKLRRFLESLTQDYSYLSLNQKSDYYNTANSNDTLESSNFDSDRESIDKPPVLASFEQIEPVQTGFTNPTFELENGLCKPEFEDVSLDNETKSQNTINDQANRPTTGLMKFLKQANPNHLKSLGHPISQAQLIEKSSET